MAGRTSRPARHRFSDGGSLVAQTSKSADRTTLYDWRVWKPAIQQTWKSALRNWRRDVHHDQAMLVRFHHDLDTQKLRAKPLSIVTATDVVRLTY
jgi:hypothetical protein